MAQYPIKYLNAKEINNMKGLRKYTATSKKGAIEFQYTCFINNLEEHEERLYWQKDFNVCAATLAELKERLP